VEVPSQDVYEISQARAEKAILELALFLRMLDDREDLAGYLNQTQSQLRYGRLIVEGKPEQQLKMRDVANKIIHADRFDWTFSNPKQPFLVCHGSDKEQWLRAEIDIVEVAALCGQLMH
jgi:hypothetical protein